MIYIYYNIFYYLINKKNVALYIISNVKKVIKGAKFIRGREKEEK